MAEVRRVSPREALDLEAEGYVHVDVRTPAEWAAGHPAGAPNVPWAFSGPSGMVPNPDFAAAMERLFGKDAKLVLGCRSGARSLKAATALAAAGFAEVLDQRAGFEGPKDAFGATIERGWAAEGLPVETDSPGKSWDELRVRAGL